MSKITTTAGVLVSARAYLSDERRWNRDGAYFERENGRVVSACMVGSLDYIRDLQGDHSTGAIYIDAERTLHIAFREMAGAADAGRAMTKWQDTDATHAEMLAVFDRAVEISREAA